MIESLIIGGLTNLVSKYVNFREEKARNQMEIEKEIKSRQLQLDIIRESNESNLITIKEKQIMISEVLAKSKIEFAKTARSDQVKLDKILYTRMDKTILNVTALMKPIITYAFLSIILCVVFMEYSEIIQSNMSKLYIFWKILGFYLLQKWQLDFGLER